MSDSSKDAACENDEERKRWFHHSGDLIAPLAKERNMILCHSKLNDGCDETLDRECKRPRLEV